MILGSMHVDDTYWSTSSSCISWCYNLLRFTVGFWVHMIQSGAGWFLLLNWQLVIRKFCCWRSLFNYLILPFILVSPSLCACNNSSSTVSLSLCLSSIYTFSFIFWIINFYMNLRLNVFYDRDDSAEPLSKWHVYVTGHSLGGALATLLALELSSSQLAK